MTRHSNLVRAALLALAAPLISGCVTLLPKQAAIALYRFGGDSQSITAEMSGRNVGVMSGAGAGPRVEVSLPVASQGDSILTLTGERAAYVSGGRWVSPATDLFREAAVRSLAGRGAGPAPGVLTLTVTRFEADYDEGAGVPPIVRVDAVVTLSGGGRGARSLGTVHGEQRSAQNRIGEIVRAYDAAVDRVLLATAAAIDADAQTPSRAVLAPR